MFAVSLLALITSLVNGDSISDVINEWVSLTLILILITSMCDSKHDLRKLLFIVFWTGFIGGGVIGIWQRLTGNYLNAMLYDPSFSDSWGKDLYLLTATRSNSNWAALQLISTLFVGIYLRNQRKNKVYDIAVIILALCVVFTLSRTTIVAGIISIMLLLLISKKSIRPYDIIKVVVISLMLIAIVVSVINIFEAQINAVLMDFNNTLELKGDENFSRRYSQWITSITAMLDSNLGNVFFGYGTDYKYELGVRAGFNMTTHNSFFEVLIKYGIISFVLNILAYFIAIKKYLKIRVMDRDFDPLLCGYLAVAICQMMISLNSIDSYIFIAIGSILFKISSPRTEIITSR
jgi:O-antigen ligase